MSNYKVGLLPLYIKLYDDIWPDVRGQVESFYFDIKKELEARGLNVVPSRVCRIKSEFADAVSTFENEKVDAIITLHLAYSPSLESADVLASTNIPLIVLDTTPTFDLSPGQESIEISFNHGIHGVQDMCNLLTRRGKSFLLEAGHWKESDVLDRVVNDVRSAVMVTKIRNSKIGRIGKPFSGMGDFIVPDSILEKTIGLKTVNYSVENDSVYIEGISDEDIDNELRLDESLFTIGDLNEDIYRQSTKACLGVRKWIEENELTGFTVNFLDIKKGMGIPCMPFMEACKAMSRGIGYAGEGDVLTAALVGMLMSVYPETSFAEMFCPDWKNNSILISHMGEMNISLSDIKPVLMEKDFPFTDADNTVVSYGRFKGGDGLFVNLSPNKGNRFSLIVSPIRMLKVNGEDKMGDSIRGWFQPTMPISDFLALYSRHGGTHHGAIVYGGDIDILKKVAELMNWNFICI